MKIEEIPLSEREEEILNILNKAKTPSNAYIHSTGSILKETNGGGGHTYLAYLLATLYIKGLVECMVTLKPNKKYVYQWRIKEEIL